MKYADRPSSTTTDLPSFLPSLVSIRHLFFLRISSRVLSRWGSLGNCRGGSSPLHLSSVFFYLPKIFNSCLPPLQTPRSWILGSGLNYARLFFFFFFFEKNLRDCKKSIVSRDLEGVPSSPDRDTSDHRQPSLSQTVTLDVRH